MPTYRDHGVTCKVSAQMFLMVEITGLAGSFGSFDKKKIDLWGTGIRVSSNQLNTFTFTPTGFTDILEDLRPICGALPYEHNPE